MSLEKAIEALTASNAALTAATDRNTSILERVLAGQEAAMSRLETATGGGKGGKGGKADKGQAAAEDPKPAAAAATDTKKNDKPAATAPVATQERLKDIAMKWRKENPDEAVIKAKGEFLMAMVAHFGAKMLTGQNGLTDPEQLKQAIFFVQRKAAGLEVDFGADYDFDGAVDQGATSAPEAEEDPLG